MKEDQILYKELFWPTPIYKIDLSSLGLKKLFSEHAFELENNKQSRTLSNVGGFQSKLLDPDEEPWHNLKAIIDKVCTKMMDLNIDWVVIEQMWLNINRKNNFNILHNHGGQYTIAGTYYVSVPKNSGKIVFRNPAPGAVLNPTFLWDHFQGELQRFDVHEGMLLLWPSYLEHFVDQSETDEPRISISFDLNAYKTTIAVNISHNASVCVYGEDGMEYFEEDRYHRVKNWEPHPYRLGEDLKYLCFDNIKQKKYEVAYASIDRSVRNFQGIKNYPRDEEYIKGIQRILKKNPDDYYFNQDHHHLHHALCGFYFSKFDEAVAVVIDGGGTKPASPGYQEVDSIYLVNKKEINQKYCHYSNIRYLIKPPIDQDWIPSDKFVEQEYMGIDSKFSLSANPAFRYELLTAELGLGDGFSAGKTMGLASYADNDKKFDLDYEKVNKAKKLQDWSLQYSIELIKKAKTYSDCKNFVLSGGYFLNCTNNYKLLKEFPDINFFVDPICHDGGTAIGVAVYYRDYIKKY